MDTRTLFLNACNEIATSLSGFGFNPIQKGQTLKKLSFDKDIFFEIYFQSSYLNDKSNIIIIPHFHIYSKLLKKWSIEQTKNNFEKGLIYTNQIGYVSPIMKWREWNLANRSYGKSIYEITGLIKDYIFPIFEIFNSKIRVIEFLKSKGTKFNKWTENSLHSIDFMLCFAEKNEAEQYFNNFIESCNYKEKIIQLYKDLEFAKKVDLNFSEFYFANKVKLAFVNKIKIYSLL